MIINLIKTFSNLILLLSFLIYNGYSISFLICLYLLYCSYKYFTEDSKLIYNKTEKNQKLIKNSKMLKNPRFKPNFLLSNHYLQLLFQNRIQNTSVDLKFTKEKVHSTGATLDWIEIASKDPIEISSDKILFLIPGLTGGKENNYICNISYEGLKNNFIVVVYQNRMLTGEFFTPQAENHKKFDFFEDLDHALELVQLRHPGKKIYAVGFSYGANKLVKYLGTKNLENKRIHCGVSLGNPFDLLVCQRTMSPLMDKLLLSFLKKSVTSNYEKYEHLSQHYSCDIKMAMRAKTVREFDEYIVRRLLGFDSVDDYYRGISCVHDIRKVNVPLLCVNSLDDSISNAKSIPYDEVNLNENIFFLVTSSGSHLGWISNESLFQLKQWINEPIMDFFNSIGDKY